MGSGNESSTTVLPDCCTPAAVAKKSPESSSYCVQMHENAMTAPLDSFKHNYYMYKFCALCRFLQCLFTHAQGVPRQLTVILATLLGIKFDVTGGIPYLQGSHSTSP